jgi:Carboxypeptidase regulatory-like domain/TonB dependent receptor
MPHVSQTLSARRVLDRRVLDHCSWHVNSTRCVGEIMTKLRFCLISLFALLCALTAMAQIQNGQFAGTVTDPSGAAVPNAKITMTNAATGLSVTATSNATGAYQVAELPPGTYKVTIEAAGFKTYSDSGVTLNAGSTTHVDAKMTLGQTREVVEVTGEASQVNTEEAKLATTISTTQIENLPLNGRNVYDLMQLAPGAVNVMGVDFENGHNTVVNGLREDFNGFLINGVANKGLSGGVNNTPIEDTVQEFQQLQLNMSAQYGNSAGSVNNLVTKSGTNSYHGSVWEYIRNDKFDANDYFLNATTPITPREPLRFNQFGGTLGGAIVKDKLFFFGSYQGDRFTSSGTPQTTVVESPEWRQAVITGQPNSVAALLYQNFTPSIPGSMLKTLDTYAPATCNITDPTCAPANYVPSSVVPYGTPIYSKWLCPDNSTAVMSGKMQTMLGVNANDIAIMNYQGCSATPAANPNGFANRGAAFINSSTAIFNSQTQSLGNLFNGNEASARLDYNWNANNRTFAQFNWFHSTDAFGPCNSPCSRGFSNPSRSFFPNGQLSYVHTFSGTVVNEFRVGYTQNNTGIQTNHPGVPSIYFDDGTVGFGSYSGYPQFFKEHDYSYGDMLSISHGKHNIKVGVDFKRNLENSEFNVARPSYEMKDPIFFSADAPSEEVAGVDPGFVTNSPAQLATNIRHWRNVEFGTYFQDDWKASRRLTLNLGLRYDLFTRHTELNNLATTFDLGPGVGIANQVASANVPVGATEPGGAVCNPSNANTVILAGVCGPGGFAASPNLGKGDHTDFGPRVGFAYDVFGDGKTSLRGGFGVSYESTLYNPLSNSRWDPPYYSFNLATGLLNGGNETLIYGPSTCTSTACSPSGATPTFSGPGTNPNQGTGAQAAGNIGGWASFNPDTAYLTGIVLPQGIKDPYVYNDFFSVQREIMPKTVLEVDYVGTISHKLFRAQDINRQAGGGLPQGACVTDNLGRNLCSLETAINSSGRPNGNYGILRNWQNAVNSAYNGLQASLKRQMGGGLLFNVSYTYSHSIDEGSTWHSGATTASGGAGGDGYSTDQALPGLDRGNSVFDIRHRLVLNYVYLLPGKSLHGVAGAALGGWQYSGIWAMQTGAHWSPYSAEAAALGEVSSPSTSCTVADVSSGNCANFGGDFNLDGGKNDRPNSSIAQFGGESRKTWATGWCPAGATPFINAAGGGCGTAAVQSGLPVLSAPCLACTGNLGRNQFLGPGQFYADMTLGKTFNLTERMHLKFEWQAFNVFNRANFLLAVAGGGAANHVSAGNFGQAAGTLNPRQMQFDLKLSF